MAEEAVATETTPAAEPAAPVEPTPAAPAAEPAQTESAQAQPQDEGKPQEEGAPEDYGDFSDEKGVMFSSKDMPEFTAMARELGLSKDRAQKLLMTMVPTMRNKLQSSTASIQASWRRSLATDPEFGGENVRENMAIATTAYRKFVTKDLNDLLSRTGLAAHPDIVRMFYRLGKSMSQDTGVTGEGAPAPKRRLFPNSNM